MCVCVCVCVCVCGRCLRDLVFLVLAPDSQADFADFADRLLQVLLAAGLDPNSSSRFRPYSNALVEIVRLLELAESEVRFSTFLLK